MDAALSWTMIAAMGLYQGLNPPMGWLLAAGRCLQQRSGRPLIGTVVALAWGHYLAMVAVLLPAALLLVWSSLHPTSVFAALWLRSDFSLSVIGIVLAGFGTYKLIRPRHPILLARVHPDQKVRWSFLMAFLHCGSPIMMLAPFLMLATPYATPLCGTRGTAYFMLPLAIVIPAVMVLPLALVASGIALIVWRFLGLKALTRVWLNFDLGWAASYLLMAGMALTMGHAHVGKFT